MTGPDKRRARRHPGRFRVAVREKLATWVTLTEDVSARGCRLEMKRALAPGALVQLAFDMGGAEPLLVPGQVAWVSRETSQAGSAFLSFPRVGGQTGADGDAWIERLVGAHANAAA